MLFDAYVSLNIFFHILRGMGASWRAWLARTLIVAADTIAIPAFIPEQIIPNPINSTTVPAVAGPQWTDL